MTLTETGVVRRSPLRISADPARVITKLFVPGQSSFDHQESRAAAVLKRILALGEDEVERSIDDIVTRFENRHRSLDETFRRHADELSDRLDLNALSPKRRLLLGATFTSEFAVEGAAICNPSVVVHPDQTGVAPGGLRFVMSVRCIGEGHRSSIGFRTGTVDAAGETSLDRPPPFASTGVHEGASFDAAAFRCELERLGGRGESADYVFDALGPRFTAMELERALGRLQSHLATRGHGGQTITLIRTIAERTYGVRFGTDVPLTERILWPAMGAESHGMEDARLVRFVDDDGCVTYYATYTAYDGSDIRQQLLETTDFSSFTSSPLTGSAAANKGLALFPRRINGRFAALSRADRETNTIAFSDNVRQWDSSLPCQAPTRLWEMLQLGNCGSPIETDAGWLVLTHGVGPMRTYSIGALLLDIDDPTRLVGQLQEPLLSPSHDEQDGYVPNVVYSCGALLHADTLVLPYGIGDAAIGIATASLPALLDVLCSTPG